MPNQKSQRTENHVKESISKRLFEEAIEPWIPIAWSTSDYGIDATVQIFKEIEGKNDYRDESKFFLIQLKSTGKDFKANGHISLQVSVAKIVSWYNSNIPVMLAFCHIPTKTLYYKWVDSSMISSLGIEKRYWERQKNIQIKFNEQNKFTDTSKNNIVEYLLSSKSNTGLIISPGKYFEFRDSALNSISELEQITKESNFESIHFDLSNLKKSVDNSIYSIAVTGPSRVGKSTLINKLIRANKEITPTGLFQTTGVPIQILPGANQRVIVEFKNGIREEHSFSIETVEKYGSQDHNPDNQKNVNQIHVEISNKDLEQGVTIFDVPGLDDPNDEITQTSKRIVDLSNAIIYVMDISRAAHGGFLITKDDKQILIEYGKKLDKIFLVLNKADALPEEILSKTKTRILLDIEKLGLTESVGDKIYYLGNKTSNQINTTEEFREDIWRYLLNEDKSGIARLLVSNGELLKTVSKFQQLLNTSLLNNVQIDKLINALEKVKDSIPEFKTKITNERVRISRELLSHLSNRQHRILFDLQKKLDSIPVNDPLPTAKDIKEYLTRGVNDTIQETHQEFVVTISRFSEEIHKWAENNFKEVREIISEDQGERVIYLQEIDEFTIPQVNIASAFGFGFLSAFVTSLFNPGYSVLIGVVGFFSNIIIGAEGRRKNRVSKIIIEAQRRYDKTFERVTSEFYDILDTHLKLLEDQVLDSHSYFIKDLNKQISQLGTQLSQDERRLYEKLMLELRNFVQKIKVNNEEIGKYAGFISN